MIKKDENLCLAPVQKVLEIRNRYINDLQKYCDDKNDTEEKQLALVKN